MKVRRDCQNWLLVNPPPLVESLTDWQDRIKEFGLTNERRKQGDEHSLCGLAGVFTTRINVILVTTSGHRTEQYNPPRNRMHSEEVWLIDLNLEHTLPYLSTTKILNTTPRIPPSTTGGANGITARIRRVIGSTEPINDPTPAVVEPTRGTYSGGRF